MSLATGACAYDGSPGECSKYHRCWEWEDEPLCWPDCANYSCAGECDEDGSCSFTATTDCDKACGIHCTGDRPVDPGTPGQRCTCDAECHGTEANPGICVMGICMTRSTETCTMPGSLFPCPAGQGCWSVQGYSFSVCWPFCANYSCAGVCEDGVCTPSAGMACDTSCGSVCEPMSQYTCSQLVPNGTCPTGKVCQGGTCVDETPSNCPNWRCTGTDCSTLIPMPGSYDANSDQAKTDGYYIDTYPKYAYVRKDVSLVLRYAACEVARKFPNTYPLAFADMTQADGNVPGTDVGSPRHPEDCHHGESVDTAYYQTDGANNYQIICGDGSDNNWNGQQGTYNDGYYCTTQQNIVDWAREMYFWSKIAEAPGIHWLGIDRTLEDDFTSQARTMLNQGQITNAVHTRMTGYHLGYDAPNSPYSWWAFHHHHTHVEFYASTASPPPPGAPQLPASGFQLLPR